MGGSKKKRSQLKKSRAAAEAPIPATGPGVFTRVQEATDTLMRRLGSWRTLIEVCAVLAIFAFGVFCRLEDLSHWKQIESRTFHDGKPIHTTFDAWFYLSLAQDLLDGTYERIDEKRGVPQSPPRPSPPPMISVLAAAAVRATGASLCWIGAVLPALLGPLLVVPLYLLARFYGGPVCALFACLMAVLYPFYIVRSNLGRFDTDCLILTFSLGASYLFMRFGLVRAASRYVYVCAGAALTSLFLWWWDQTPAAVCALTGLPLLTALVFFYRPKLREGIVFYTLLIGCAAAALAWLDPALPLKLVNRLWREFLYITKEQSGIFPNVGTTISEQKIPSFRDIVNATTAAALPFYFAAAGFLLLIWRRRAHTLFLLPFVIISFLAFTTANRFILFLIPLVALGTGYAAACLWELCRRARPLNSLACIGIAAVLAVPLYQYNSAATRMPKEHGFMVEAMRMIGEKTPEDAVIWAWWDHGYALTYYSRRATVNDGSIHGGELTVYNAIPYTTQSFRLSANFMQFYVSRGMQGMHRIKTRFSGDGSRSLQFILEVLEAGPEAARAIIEQAQLKPDRECSTTDDWLAFFFPAESRPVYLVCDNLLSRTAYWWYWFGTWDTNARQGTHPRFKAFSNIRFDRKAIRGAGGLDIDRTAGTFLQNGSRYPLSRITMHSRTGPRTINNYGRAGLRFDFNREHRNGAIMDNDIARSVFSRLFIRVRPDRNYFTPVINSPPYAQLWKVTGDRAEPRRDLPRGSRQ